MPPRTLLITALLKLLNAAAHIITWYALMLALVLVFRHLPAEPYTQGSEIHPRFSVLVRNTAGEVLPVALNRWQSNETLVREAYVANDEYGEYFRLQPLAPDTFELYVNNEWFESSQRYRITADNRVVPLSFKTLSGLGQVLLCFVLSFPLFALFKWLLRRLFRLPQRLHNTPKAA